MEISLAVLERQFALHGAEYEEAALRVLRSGWYVLGKEVEAFEREFAAYVGAKHCVAVNSGLDALTLSVRALGIGAGDEAIVPANTYIATALAVTENGARPVFVEPDASYCLAADRIEAAITERTRAILAVHLYGQAADMEAIGEVARRHALPVIEDCAQSHGAHCAGRMTGTFGAAGCFSFYPTKNLGAFGDAGAVVTDDAALAGHLRKLRNYGSKVKYQNEAEFVNWLMDDDRFLPNKIETMVEYFLAHPDVSLVTSYRPCMDERGERLPDLPYTKPLFDRVTKLDGRSAGNLILTENVNVIGESTTPLIRKALLLEGHRLGWTGREGKYLVSDFPTWLRLLASGSLIYIPEALSEFRQHGGQAQAHADVAFICQIGWAMAIREAIESKSFLLKDAEKKAAILIWLANTATAMGLYQDDAEWAQQRGRDLRTVFSAMAAALENGYRIQFDIDTTLHLNMQGESK